MSKDEQEIQTYLKIPSSILQDKELTNMTIKVVYARIHWRDKLKPKPGCWESNKNIAKFLGISSSSVSNYIGKLEDLGKIRRDGLGKDRMLFSNLPIEELPKDSEVEGKDNLLNFQRQPIKHSDTTSESLVTTSECLRPIYNINNTEDDNIKEDVHQQFHKSIVKWGMVGKDYPLTHKDISQLKGATEKMLKFYKKSSCKDMSIWFEELYYCLQQNYWAKGKTVHIGNLCNNHTWGKLMPSFLRDCRPA